MCKYVCFTWFKITQNIHTFRGKCFSINWLLWTNYWSNRWSIGDKYLQSADRHRHTDCILQVLFNECTYSTVLRSFIYSEVWVCSMWCFSGLTAVCDSVCLFIFTENLNLSRPRFHHPRLLLRVESKGLDRIEVPLLPLWDFDLAVAAGR